MGPGPSILDRKVREWLAYAVLDFMSVAHGHAGNVGFRGNRLMSVTPSGVRLNLLLGCRMDCSMFSAPHIFMP